ncbi:hypothetical protein ANAPC5_01280 [Anaplasma phagocytophilum]|nr:hypothetical protein ANAPC2_00676 [Anaplasma phagocytophilum]SBO31733.1 hypothetical protein ANAPC3_00623 [Anaplasma phagocytophilum]SBO32192.1 hypothetical protein ANAPC4_00727 [Anaplasma phagocytophilum]SCV63241.1 hypothetical protein ANAPH2_00575 [Anaplasma phagocytophilum]SCV65927.1 hypothetical protein ANAPC5_01280 [Anaplasma phagocytophilum]
MVALQVIVGMRKRRIEKMVVSLYKQYLYVGVLGRVAQEMGQIRRLSIYETLLRKLS